SYGESQNDGSGWPAGHGARTGRLWPLLSGERGEYELAAGHPAASYLQTMANAANDGYLIPEQAWDRANQFGFTFGESAGSASPPATSVSTRCPVRPPTTLSAMNRTLNQLRARRSGAGPAPDGRSRSSSRRVGGACARTKVPARPAASPAATIGLPTAPKW